MPTNNLTYNDIWRRLASIYDTGEAKAITRNLLEDMYDMSFADVLCNGIEHLSTDEREALNVAINRLMDGEPLQYITGKCRFCGQEFNVGPGVLIPRPETEWLVEEMSTINVGPDTRILDIGTGSGCIATSVALSLHNTPYVEAWDISDEALDIAHDNAMRLGAKVHFDKRDALHLPTECHTWDVIVSNPPYICYKEQRDMNNNVLLHEPHGALFVPDDNPLLFYRAIATYAKKALKSKGVLLFECNTLYVADTAAMLRNMGFHNTIMVDDCFGKPRFVRGSQI